MFFLFVMKRAFNNAENEYFAKDLSNSEAADLVAGFIFGLTGQDVQTKLTSCMKASPNVSEPGGGLRGVDGKLELFQLVVRNK